MTAIYRSFLIGIVRGRASSLLSYHGLILLSVHGIAAPVQLLKFLHVRSTTIADCPRAAAQSRQYRSLRTGHGQLRIFGSRGR